jgi:hypothetical protein
MSGIKVSKGPDLKKAAVLVENGVQEAGEDIAQEAYNEIRKRLNQVLQHPTGHYESRVMTSTQSNTLVISDGGVIYGPWLEGTSSRNGRTRFKGYHVFREIQQRMVKQADTIADAAISEAVRKI